MDNNRVNSTNVVFIALISVSIALLAGFIFSAISLVIIRGIPALGSSLLSREIQFAVKLSMSTSIISTLLCMIFAVPAAYGLARLAFPAKKLINAVLNIPIALPPLVSGVALLLLFGTTAFGRELAARGIEFVFTPLGIVIAQFFVNVPYMVTVLRSTIHDIDPRMEFVARTLGCNRLQSFLRVTLPLARNGLIAGMVITWARALGEFGAVLMLCGATRLKTEILPISLFLNMSTGDLDLALAAASILIIISLVSLFLFELLSGNQYEISRVGIPKRG
ncbi:MAG: ABC transporter permease [Syntrophomonadaceae bacterium]|nr:ABC transporter permease [Syntrophomonadaceae bacterium]MDD3890205.1 ABC transporter permease [Syntrophomonadaceae bacterium]MDD4550528.1 ABC transporter permease [Syntrophomonadaceae bacterium]